MGLLKGVVVEPATHKNGKTSIAVKCDGVIHRIYASGEYHPYFRFQVGDSVLITMGSDNKPRIIENEIDVRQAVARHPRCAAETLAQLANDDCLSVRVMVAEHPNCPPQTLTHLANVIKQTKEHER